MGNYKARIFRAKKHGTELLWAVAENTELLDLATASFVDERMA